MFGLPSPRELRGQLGRERKVEAQVEGGWFGFHRPLMGCVVGSHLKGRRLQGQELSANGTDS